MFQKKRKIRILQPVAGLTFQWSEGDIVELPESEARKWADGERAEPVDWDNDRPAADPPPSTETRSEQRETTMSQPPENAAARTGRPAGRPGGNG